ncbi:MAG: hypothetical protein CMJ80_16300 [Planctomycetaceae bacterium]|nr:hypothetical protein [Planctomycetaceae bacterium]
MASEQHSDENAEVCYQRLMAFGDIDLGTDGQDLRQIECGLIERSFILRRCAFPISPAIHIEELITKRLTGDGNNNNPLNE